MGKILITGASGFIGKELLKNENFRNSIVIGRSKPLDCDDFIYFDFNLDSNYSKLFKNIDYVIHLAGLAHLPNKNNNSNLSKFTLLNTKVTSKLAYHASKSNVKKFIYISSIKVLGESTEENASFNNLSPYRPKDNYAISKVDAEKSLIKISKDSKMKYVIIRPPLVYGPKVKGNLLTLKKMIDRGFYLPFGSFKNKRSYVSVNNLIDLIHTCLMKSEANNKIFLISDGKDLMTSEFISAVSIALKNRSRVFSFPKILLKIIFYLVGKGHLYYKLDESLIIDHSYTVNTLNWIPKYDIHNEIKRYFKN